MIREIDSALCSLQSAVEARRLYCADHPVARSREVAAREALARCANAHPDAMALLLPDRVVVGNEPLPSGKQLARGGLGILRGRGVAALRFHGASDDQEIDAVIRCMLAPDQPLPDSKGLILCATPEAGSGVAKARGPTGAPLRAAERVRGVIDPLAARGEVEAEELTNLAGELADLIFSHSDALIPLAGLRDHDEYTYVHTLNVAMLSGALAEAAGLPAEKVRDITFAALLHDVGKARTPLELLNKGGKLSDEELRIIRRHPEEGARILIAAEVSLDVAIAVAYEHHMHRTGGGYPKAPPGWRMHAASQIVQVADVFDALRTHRPYRPALSDLQARELMERDSGRIFDPALLSLFFQRVAGRAIREAA